MWLAPPPVLCECPVSDAPRNRSQGPPTLQEWDSWLAQAKSPIAHLGIHLIGVRWSTHVCVLDTDYLQQSGTFKVAKAYPLSLEVLQAIRPNAHAVMHEMRRRRCSKGDEPAMACSFVVVTWAGMKGGAPASFSRVFGFGMSLQTQSRMLAADAPMQHLIKAVNMPFERFTERAVTADEGDGW